MRQRKSQLFVPSYFIKIIPLVASLLFRSQFTGRELLLVPSFISLLLLSFQHLLQPIHRKVIVIVPLRRYLSSSLATDDRSLFHRPLEKRGNRDSSSSALRLVQEADKQKRATYSFSLFSLSLYFILCFLFSKKHKVCTRGWGEGERNCYFITDGRIIRSTPDDEATTTGNSSLRSKSHVS